jgi:hypothetical protein
VAGEEHAERRKERLARNESLFREVNERIGQISDHGSFEPIEFLCECGEASCTETIPLSRSEYEQVRSDPLLFVIKPGHGTADVEAVVEEEARYEIVRKHEAEGRIARETDPRG